MDYEGQQLYKFVLKENEEPDEGGYHEAFLVCADTERKAWLTIQAYLKSDDSAEEARAWLKGAKKVSCEHVGEAFESVRQGILILSYIPD